MAELNTDLPVFDCFVRKEYLYDLQAYHGEYEHCTVFGLASVQGRALGFHVLTEKGAQIARLPVSSLVTKEHPPHLPLHYLQLWDCFSYEVSVCQFSWLQEMRCKVILRDKQLFDGTYYVTVDWYGNHESKEPGEDGHKNAHVIFLDCGCIAAQPNNRILWHEPSFITNPCKPEMGERPDYLINTHKWKCELDNKWTAEDSYRMFYDDHFVGKTSEEVKKELTQEKKVKLAKLRALADVNWPSKRDNHAKN